MFCALLGVLLVRASLARADDTTPAPDSDDKVIVTMDEDTKKATAEALKWLAANQNADGSWSSSDTGGKYPHNPAMTGFSLLAFMSQGNLPGQGQYAKNVSSAARFLMAAQREKDGYLGGRPEGNMYCHGIATLALAELLGMYPDEELRASVKKAVDLTIGCQSRQQGSEGGWRYQPQPTDADISVTIMQVMALRTPRTAASTSPMRLWRGPSSTS